jgi:hypothetical protein
MGGRVVGEVKRYEFRITGMTFSRVLRANPQVRKRLWEGNEIVERDELADNPQKIAEYAAAAAAVAVIRKKLRNAHDVALRREILRGPAGLA